MMLFNTISLFRTKALLDKSIQLDSSLIDFTNNTITVSGDGAVFNDQVQQYADSAHTLIIRDSVYDIDTKAFEGFTNLTNVTILSHATTMNIRQNAFHNCASLRTVDFGNCGVSFEVSAFEGCVNLSSITIKGTVNTIPSSTFKNCVSLESVILENTPRDFTIEDSAFFGCQNLFTFRTPTDHVTVGNNAFNGCVNLQDIIIGQLVGLGASSFQNTGISQVVISLSDTVIPESMFEGATNLKFIGFLGNVKEIKPNAFKNCASLESFYFQTNNLNSFTIGASAFSGCANLVSFRTQCNSTVIGESAFEGCTSLNDLVIGKIESLGARAFANSQVSQVLLTGENYVIPTSAFEGCTSLMTVGFIGTVSEIQESAFKFCTSLKSIVMNPADTVTIGDTAFYACKDLEQLHIPQANISVGANAFFHCQILRDIFIGPVVAMKEFAFAYSGVSQVYIKIPDVVVPEGAFDFCDDLVSVQFHSTVKEIQDNAFRNCFNLQSLVFYSTDSTLNIGDYAFVNCYSLTVFHCPSESVNVGVFAFYGCTSLNDFIIGAVTSFDASSFANTGISQVYINMDNVEIPTAAFSGCSQLNNVIIKGSVSVINQFAFKDCESLTSLIITPTNRSMFTFEESCFEGCTNLVTLHLLTDASIIENNAFNGCLNLVDLIIGVPTKVEEYSFANSGITQMYINIQDIDVPAGLFSGCHKLEFVTFPGKVKSIGEYSFHGCSSLHELVLDPFDFTTFNFPAYSFCNCTSLQNLKVQSEIVTIGSHAFHGCRNLSGLVTGIPTHVEEYSFAHSGIEQIFLMISDIDVPAGLFCGCERLQTVEFLEKVKTLSEYSFHGCTALTRLVFYPVDTNTFNIPRHAFSNCTSLTVFHLLTDTITVESNAFNGCVNLVDFVIGSVISVGNYSFAHTGISSVYLNISRIVIPEGLFDGCHNLSTVIFKDTVSKVGVNSFRNCSSLDTFKVEPSDQQLFTVDDRAFEGASNLYEFNVLTKTISLGSYTFAGCSSLSNIIMGQITSIGKGAFMNSNVTQVVITGNSSPIPDELFKGCSNLQALGLAGTYSGVGKDTFNGCNKLESLEINPAPSADADFHIGEHAFTGCSSLRNLHIPCSSVSVGTEAFKGLNHLVSLIIGGITELGEYAFADSSITQVFLKSDDFVVPEGAFDGCILLSNVLFLNKVKEIKAYAFRNCFNIDKLIFNPSGSTLTLGDSAFQGCTEMTVFHCPSEFVTLGKNVFNGCSNLYDIIIGMINSAGDYAFAGTEVSQVLISGQSFEVAEGLFDGCKKLNSVMSTGKIAKVNAFAFRGCISLKSLALPTNGQEILFGESSFEGCSKLFTLHLPSETSIIDNNAFSGCTSLCDLILGTITSIGINSFANTNISQLFIRNDEGSIIPSGVFSGCAYLQQVFFANKVYGIEDSAFANCCKLQGLSLNPYIMDEFTVGENAFYNCISMYTFRAPVNTISLGDYAFYNCRNLSDLIIGEIIHLGTESLYKTQVSQLFLKLDELEPKTFKNSTQLRAVFLSTSKAIDIPVQLFQDCHRLETFQVVNGKIKSIGSNAFMNCYSLRSISLNAQDAAISVGDNAFSSCFNLATCHIQSETISLGKNAFYNCYELEDIIIGRITQFSDGTFHGTGVTQLYLTTDVLPRNGLTNLTKLEKVYIDCKQTEIPEGFVADCISLNDFTVEGKVTKIGDASFKGCSKLQTVIIAGGDTMPIGKDAFNGCHLLNKFHAPATLTSPVGDRAFVNCTNLKDIFIGALSYVGSHAFQGTKISQVLFSNDKSNEEIHIGTEAFNGCSVLDTVKITSKSQIKIPDQAFDGCANLKLFNVDGPIVSAGFKAFHGCALLPNVTFTSENPIIGAHCFCGCKSLKTAQFIGSKMVNIPEYAFNECNSLESITINGIVKSIGRYGFYHCYKLESIQIESLNNIPIGMHAFCECSSMKTVTINAPSVEFGMHSFCGCALRKLNFNGIVKGLQPYAFNNATRLESLDLTFADDVPTIPEYCFNGCTLLTAVTIKGHITTVESHAFHNCISLCTATFNSDAEMIVGPHAFCGSGIKTFMTKGSVALSQFAFHMAKDLTSLDVKSVTKLGVATFGNCSSLESIPLDNKVEDIPESCFEGTSKYTLYNLNVTTIGPKAFFNSGLKNVTIKKENINIKSQAFAGCKELESVMIGGNISSIEAKAFENDAKLSEFIYCGTSQLSGENVFPGCTSLNEIKVSIHTNATKLLGLSVETTEICNSDDDNQHEKKVKIAIISTITASIIVAIVVITIVAITCFRKKQTMALISSAPLLSQQDNL